MTHQLFILPLTSDNLARFDAFARPYIDADKCMRLTEPSDEAAVEAFISSNRGAFFNPENSWPIEHGTRYGYSVDGISCVTLPTPPLPSANRATHETYVRHANKLVFADVGNGNLKIHMDPLHETAVFFKARPDAPWSIVTTRIVPKADYLHDLLDHPGVKGIDGTIALTHQLSLFHFKNAAGEITQVLSRNYLMRDAAQTSQWIEYLPLYIRNPDGSVQRGYSYEDQLADSDVFKDEVDFIQSLRNLGEFQSKRFIEPTERDLCDDFANGDFHYEIYKTPQTALNNNLVGEFLQRDDNGYPLIQDYNATSLDKLLRAMAQPTLRRTGAVQTKPSVASWQGYVGGLAQNITPRADGSLQINLAGGGYIHDTGSKLSLHGQAEDEYLEAMVMHAKNNWGGKFKIESGSADVKLKLYTLALLNNVSVAGYTPPAGYSPPRPTTARRVTRAAPSPGRAAA